MIRGEQESIYGFGAFFVLLPLLFRTQRLQIKAAEARKWDCKRDETKPFNIQYSIICLFAKTCNPTRGRASTRLSAKVHFHHKTTCLPTFTPQSRSLCWALVYSPTNRFKTSGRALSSSKVPTCRKSHYPRRVVRTSPSRACYTSSRQNGDATNAIEMNGKLNGLRCGCVFLLTDVSLLLWTQLSGRMLLGSNRFARGRT